MDSEFAITFPLPRREITLPCSTLSLGSAVESHPGDREPAEKSWVSGVVDGWEAQQILINYEFKGFL